MVGAPGIQMHHRGGGKMKVYRVVKPKRFKTFADVVQIIVWIVLVILFVKFMNAHNGLEPRVVEYHTYEIVRETSPENNRVKVPVTREVVYKYIYQ